jgi:hypothetical protein
MCIVKVKGWEVVAGRNDQTGENQFKEGDKCVYFPPETVIPHELSDRLGVTKYLTPLPKDEEGNRPEASRIRVARLRGEASYGLLIPCEDESWEVGHNVSQHYGAYKYDPPQPCNDGDAERDHPAFHTYYDMENIKNFPTQVFQPGDEVVVTEKIHGMNCRLGLIKDSDDEGNAVWRWMAGSHDVRRKPYSTPVKRMDAVALHEKMILDYPGVAVGQLLDFKNGTYWRVDELVESEEEDERVLFRATRVTQDGEEVQIPSDFWRYFTPEVKAMMIAASECGYQDDPDGKPVLDTGRNVVLFGERYGSGVQGAYTYGRENGVTSLRVFDITLDRKYLDFDVKWKLFEDYGVPTVPLLYRGPFSQEKIDELTDGASECRDGEVEDDSVKVGREGVVIVSAQEKPVVTEEKVFERSQLKSISFAYLARKGGTEFH